ncbi:MAG: hypothetical protein ACI8UO_005017 [Verrucomicrobiales bacterium]|jgi:hypothetical protein
MKISRVILSLLVGFVVPSGVLEAQDEERYPEPIFSRPIFDREAVPIPSAARIAAERLLLEIAMAEGVNPVLKAKALAYAFALTGSSAVKEANFHLVYSIPFPFGTGDKPLNDMKIAPQLKSLLSVVLAADNSDGGRASVFLEDIGWEIAPETFTERPKISAASWGRYISGYQGAANQRGATGSNKAISIGRFPRKNAKLSGVFFAEFETDPTTDATTNRLKMLEEGMKTNSISAEVLPDSGLTSIEVFDTSFPPELQSAYREMVKMFSLRATPIPPGNHIVIRFEKGYSGADGPTAVLATAILVDSLANDYDLDPNFAAVGDLNADGTIQPVYQIEKRAMAAVKARQEWATDISTPIVDVMAIPEANAGVLGDLLLNSGVEPLLKTQIFIVKTFDEAAKLARSAETRDEKLQDAIKRFAEIQKALDRPNPASYLKSAEVQKRLKEVVDLAPSHASAKLLLLAGLNRAPQKYTLGGSLKLIQEVAMFVEGKSASTREGYERRKAMQSARLAGKYKTLDGAVASLKSMRENFHPASEAWVTAIVNYQTLVQRRTLNLGSDQRSELEAEINQAANRVDLEFDKLQANPEAQELLMR